MALEPGARLGPYEIVSPAGAGGMGEVYRALDTRLDRTVAIKVLPPNLTSDPPARQRFEREARAVAALSHPHICTLHDIGQQDGTDFLVMESRRSAQAVRVTGLGKPRDDQFDVTPDGQRFLLAIPEGQQATRLTVLTNWASVLTGQ